MNTVTLTDWQVLAIEVALQALGQDTSIHQPSLELLQQKFYDLADISWGQGDRLDEPEPAN